MNQEKCCLIYTTISNKKEAKGLSSAAIKAKLAACVNIIPGGLSLYMWQGKIIEDDEYYLIFKTSCKLSPKLETWLRENHPYELPAIIKFNVDSTGEFVNFLEKCCE